MRIGICIEPLDVLLFGDGRPFSVGGIANSLDLPLPQTMAGALRTWLLDELGCDWDRLADLLARGASFAEAAAEQSETLGQAAGLEIRGPWLMRDDDRERLFPAPATLVRRGEDDDVALGRLRPLPEGQAPPGWRASIEGTRPLWPEQPGEWKRTTGYLTTRGMKAFLAGGLPSREDLVPRDALLDRDNRVGIAIHNDTGTVEESMLYSVGFCALKAGLCFYAEFDAPNDRAASAIPQAPGLIRLGGESRRAQVSRCTALAPDPDCVAPDKPTVHVLASPGFVDADAPPEGLIAAAWPTPTAVSGWDYARRGPKPARFAVPAGAVFYYNSTPAQGALYAPPDDAAVGWGAYLTGTWSDE